MFLGITDTELAASSNLGIYFIIMTALYTLTWFSLSRGSKRILQDIIFDSKDYNKALLQLSQENKSKIKKISYKKK